MANINAGIPLKPNMTVEELVTELEKFPSDAKVKGGVSLGDRPWDSDQYRLNLRWEE